MKLKVELSYESCENLAIVSVEGGTANRADAALLIAAGLASLESFEIDDPPCEIFGLGHYAASMTLRDNLGRSRKGTKATLDRVVARALQIVDPPVPA